MGTPLPESSLNRIFVFNYLEACGRTPNVIHLSWPIDLNLPQEIVHDYYKNYFKIFRKSEPQVEKAIQNELQEYAVDGRYRSSGRMEIAITWWRSPNIFYNERQCSDYFF